MRKLIVSTFLTLDGSSRHGRTRRGRQRRLRHGGLVDERLLGRAIGQVMGEAMSSRRPRSGTQTYDIFAAYWPARDKRSRRQAVEHRHQVRRVTRSHPTLEWRNSVLIEGDAADGIAALKKKTGPSCRCMAAGT